MGGWSAKKRVSWGKKKTLNFTYICDFVGVVLSLTCVVGLCVDVCVCVSVCVCFCCCCCCCCVGKLRSFFRYPTTNTIFLYFNFFKREGFLVKKSQQVCLSLSSCCVAFLSEPQKNKNKKNKQRVGGLVKQKEGRKKKVETI